MQFEPVYKPFDKPPVQYLNQFWGSMSILVRDQFYISTWLLIGAVFQGLMCLLPYRNLALVAPAALILLYRILTPAAQTYGLIKNPWMEGVIPGRTAAVFADANGHREGREAIADQDLCVIMLAARSHHPMGLLAPGYKAVGDFMVSFVEDLRDNAEEHGFLGATQWIGASDRAASSETMGLLYFKSAEHIHAWSHGPKHTEAMKWWKNGEWSHIGLMHEIFSVPKKGWEGVYNNYHPTGLTAASSPAVIKDEQGERKVWMSPMVYGKGALRYSAGRMAREVAGAEKQQLDALTFEDGMILA